MPSPAAAGQPDGSAQTPPGRQRDRQLLGPTGLVVMVAVILGFTAVSIVVELASNWGKGGYQATVAIGAAVAGRAGNEVPVVFHITNHGRRAGHPDVCDADLLDLKGDRVGTASVTVRQDIPPGQTRDFQAIGTVASLAVNGTARCRSLEPD